MVLMAGLLVVAVTVGILGVDTAPSRPLQRSSVQMQAMTVSSFSTAFGTHCLVGEMGLLTSPRRIEVEKHSLTTSVSWADFW